MSEELAERISQHIVNYCEKVSIDCGCNCEACELTKAHTLLKLYGGKEV